MALENIASMSVTCDVSQEPIRPYGLPVVASESAKIGQDPFAVSPKHPPVQVPAYVQDPTAAFKSALFVGANTACVPMSMVQKSVKESFFERVIFKQTIASLYIRLFFEQFSKALEIL